MPSVTCHWDRLFTVTSKTTQSSFEKSRRYEERDICAGYLFVRLCTVMIHETQKTGLVAKFREFRSSGFRFVRLDHSFPEHSLLDYSSLSPFRACRLKVVAPCKCRGTQKWISFSALNGERRKEVAKWKHCPVCQVHFHVALRNKTSP